MQNLPTDTIEHVTTFLSIQELATAAQSHKDFNIPRQFREKRIQWCRRKTENKRHIRHGQCVDAKCQRQKACCIHLDPLWRSIFDKGHEGHKRQSDTPLSRQTLSHYCSTHAVLYQGVNLLA